MLKNLPAAPLPRLEPGELESVRGGAGTLDIRFTAPPLQGRVDLTRVGPKSSITGSLATNGISWSGGVRITADPSPKVSIQGHYQKGGGAWEAGIAARIRFLRA